jgi:hypothetical protein
MLAAEYILIDISLISYSPSFTNITELWNIPSAFYLYSATVPGYGNTDYQHSRKPWTLGAIKSFFQKELIAVYFGCGIKIT